MSTPVEVTLNLDLETLAKGVDVKFRKGKFYLYVPVSYQAAKDFSASVRQAIEDERDGG